VNALAQLPVQVVPLVFAEHDLVAVDLHTLDRKTVMSL
jgi:hypothetical protein